MDIKMPCHPEARFFGPKDLTFMYSKYSTRVFLYFVASLFHAMEFDVFPALIEPILAGFRSGDNL